MPLARAHRAATCAPAHVYGWLYAVQACDSLSGKERLEKTAAERQVRLLTSASSRLPAMSQMGRASITDSSPRVCRSH